MSRRGHALNRRPFVRLVMMRPERCQERPATAALALILALGLLCAPLVQETSGIQAFSPASVAELNGLLRGHYSPAIEVAIKKPSAQQIPGQFAFYVPRV